MRCQRAVSIQFRLKLQATPQREQVRARVDIERLARVPGLCLQRGLASLRYKTFNHIELLGRFVELHIDDMARLSESLVEEDSADAQLLVHTLRGIAATLGADRLPELASRVENSLRAKPNGRVRIETIQPEMGSINHELMALAAALSSAITTTVIQDASLDQDAMRPLLDELDTLLARNDTEAIVLFENSVSSLQALLGAACDALGRQINQFEFEFEAARQALQTLHAESEKCAPVPGQ